MLVEVVTLLLLTASAAESAPCLPGWTEASSACYQVVTNRLPWSEAELMCQSLGPNGHLATVFINQDRGIMTQLLESNGGYGWIGLNDIANQRSTGTDKTGWQWVSGAPYGGIVPWARDQPMDENKDCVLITDQYGQWHEDTCSNPLNYICQHDIIIQPTTVATNNVRSLVDCAAQCASNSLCTSFKFTKEDLMCQLINEGAPKERPDTSFYSAQYKQDNITHWSDEEL